MVWKLILKRLYDNGLINETRLNNAVVKGLITETEKNEILGVA